MKTVLRFFLYLIISIVVIGVCFVLYIQMDGIPKYSVEKTEFPQVIPDSASVVLGAKIASVQCVVCHTGSDHKLSGKLLTEVPPEFGEIHSANITQSKEHGIGNWSDAEIVYFLRTGVKPKTGQFVPLYMPKFPHMSDKDVKCVLAFLHSDMPIVQPSEIATVPCKPSFLTKFLSHVAFKKIPYPSATIVAPDTNNMVTFGKYLVTGRYDCYACHSADFKTVNMADPEKSPGYLGGGNALITENGNKIFSANITSDEETGIGTWTEEDFANVMRNMKNKDGHAVRPPMIPMNGLSDLEVNAMYAYLRSVPKIKDNVNRQWDNEDL